MSNKTYNAEYLARLQVVFDKTKRRSYDLLNPQPNETIIDIGCGLGDDVRVISKSGAIVIGIDNDIEMIDIAKVHDDNSENIRFIHSSADNTSLAENSIDKIRFERVFQHIADHNKLIEEAVRLLKPNGQIQIIDTDYLSLSLFLTDIKLENKIIEAIIYNKLLGASNIRQLPALLQQYGFNNITIEVHNYIFNTFELSNSIIRFDKIVNEEFNNKKITQSEFEVWAKHKNRDFNLSLNVLIINGEMV